MTCADCGGTSSDPHCCFFFLPFFLKKLKFLYKFDLVFSLRVLGLGSIGYRRLDRRSQQGGSGGAKLSALFSLAYQLP